MKRIAVLGSGNGSNAENIYRYFQGSKKISVICFCTNNKEAYIATRAEKIGIPCFFVPKEFFSDTTRVKALFKRLKVDYLILAGFLIKIPRSIVSFYPNKIINIHPSLLPKYKGLNTHERAIKNKDKFAGCSVHYVTEKLDSGKIIMQKKIKITNGDNSYSLAKKVLKQEHKIYPASIIKILN